MRIAQDLLVILRTEDKHEALALLFEGRDISVRPIEPAHALERIIGEIQQPPLGDRQRSEVCV